MKHAIILSVIMAALVAGWWFCRPAEVPGEVRPVALEKRREIPAVANTRPVPRATDVAAAAPWQAMEAAEAIATPEERGDTMGFVLAQIAGKDPDAVFRWLETNEEAEEVRTRIERAALPALAEADPPRVARWISEGRATDAGTGSAVVAVVQRWTQQDPAAAAAWVEGFDDGGMRREAMVPLVQLWAGQDPDAPAEWLNALPEGPARDEGCAAYALAIAVDEPERAARWAAKIGSAYLAAKTRERLGESR